jgi:hypothetical protein
VGGHHTGVPARNGRPGAAMGVADTPADAAERAVALAMARRAPPTGS